jgi:hypothetical protein
MTDADLSARSTEPAPAWAATAALEARTELLVQGFSWRDKRVAELAARVRAQGVYHPGRSWARASCPRGVSRLLKVADIVSGIGRRGET